jgi:hypothetical protein
MKRTLERKTVECLRNRKQNVSRNSGTEWNKTENTTIESTRKENRIGKS